jgi:hemerythrin-like domain-containing protein
VARVREDHAALRLAQDAEGLDTAQRLAAFATRLDAHVRFEERELFEVAQAKLGAAVLDAVEARGATTRACAVKV